MRFLMTPICVLGLAGCDEAPQQQDTTPVAAEQSAEAPEPEGELIVRGVGQEPGWLVRVYPNIIIYDADYAQRQIIVETPEMTVSEGVEVYVADDLAVQIVEEPCQDSMSGAEYPLTVVVVEGPISHTGCGNRDGAIPPPE